jgi:hypothetical protein
MRRLTTSWLPLVATPLIALAIAPTVRADPIPYTSYGDVGTQAGVPIGNFGFNYALGTLLMPGTFSLGSFQAQPLPDGAGLTYHNLPFFIDVTFYPQGQTGPGAYAASSDLSIQGVLNGTVTGTSFSDVVATITSVKAGGPGVLPFPLDSFNVLTPLTLAPSGINGGVTNLIAQVTAVPEPTPLALMVVLTGLTALRSGIRRIPRRKP